MPICDSGFLKFVQFWLKSSAQIINSLKNLASFDAPLDPQVKTSGNTSGFSLLFEIWQQQCPLYLLSFSK